MNYPRIAPYLYGDSNSRDTGKHQKQHSQVKARSRLPGIETYAIPPYW
jgi:hypothetical protein